MNTTQTISVEALIDLGKLIIGDGYRAKNSELSEFGLPFARVGNINTGFDFRTADRFPVQDLARVGNKVSQPGDVVFTSKGTVGRFGFVEKHIPQFVYSPQLCFWRSLDSETIDPRFLFYWMQGPEFYSQYKSVAGQTDMAEYVSLSDQRGMHISLPPIVVQRAIAHILGTLDDKIELNRRMSQTLEEIARALFKSWFVDFDPVHAKAAGREPVGMDAETAALFPSEFEDSELGLIPKGWEASQIGNHIANFDSRRVPLAKGQRQARQGAFPYYGATGILDYVDNYLFEGIYTLVGEDGSVEAKDGTAVTQYVWGQFWTNNHAHVLQGKPPISTEHVYLYFSSQHVGAFVTGAVQAKLSQGRMNTMPFVMPTPQVACAFANYIQPLFDRLKAAAEQSQSLIGIRDSLLPRLLSGNLVLS